MVGIAGGTPVGVEGVRRALHIVGIRETATVDMVVDDPNELNWLDGIVLFADRHDRIDALQALRHRGCNLPVVALIAGEVTCHDALMAGASSVTRMDSTVEEIARVVESCLVGQPVLSIGLVRELIELPAVAPPSAEESILLSWLADGETMRRMAERSGYSERHLYRLLKRLYARLGVSTRAAAIELARRRGWLPRP